MAEEVRHEGQFQMSAPVVAPDASNATVEKHLRLVDWAVQNGGFLHSAVEIQHRQQSGFHAVVAPGTYIPAETRISSTPVSATLSVLNALNIEPFGNHGCVFPVSFLRTYKHSPDVIQTFFLMEQHVLGGKSWWAPYIDTLPTVQDVEDLQFELDQDAIWIRGTNVEAAFALQNQKWHGQFATALEQLKSEGWPGAVNGMYTWQLYRWAASIYGSRSFSSQVLSDTSAAENARSHEHEQLDDNVLSKLFSDRFAVLLPVLDILNHDPVSKIEWQARHDYVGLQVLSDLQEGQEIFNNYGPRDNEGLLIAYGFVLEDNLFDHITISIQTPPGSPLEASRTWPKDERSNDDFRCFLLNAQHPLVTGSSYFERALFSYDLLDSLSVLCANDRELQNMFLSQQTLMGSALPARFDDFRNLLATISQIMQDCKARFQRVYLTDPTKLEPPLLPQSSKQRYAQIYRNNLLDILRNAIAVCTLVLVHASTNQEGADLLLTMQTRLPQNYSPDLNDLSSRLHFLTANHELFTFDALLQLLPVPTSTVIQTCHNDIEGAIRNSPQQRTHVDSIKTGFALTLAIMCIEIRSGIEYPPRLRVWIEELTSSYPPEDENWSYVPPPGPWSPEDEPPPALMTLLQVTAAIANTSNADPNTTRWLNPKMLCWGWNVMEEEGVRVPIEIEAFQSARPETVTGPMGFLIYCKQY